MRHKPFWQAPPPGQYGHIRGVYNKQQICLPLHNCIFISLVNPLPKNTIEQREDDLEEKGMYRGGKVILLFAVLF